MMREMHNGNSGLYMFLSKMKLTLAVSFCLIYLTSICAAETNNCENITDHSGVLTHFIPDAKTEEKCFRIVVPEDSYVRLDLAEIRFVGRPCSDAFVKLSVVGGNEEYKFCSTDLERKPITVLNDVIVTYHHLGDSYGRVLSGFILRYTAESLICAKKGHFRCSEHHCIHQHQVCDGIKDCEDGTDEASCDVEENYNCGNITDHSGELQAIMRKVEGIEEKCWIIVVPEDSYLRLDLKEIRFVGLACSDSFVKFRVIGENEEYKFCSTDLERKPLTVLNDVRVTYRYVGGTYGSVLSGFTLRYAAESLICAKKEHFRCSEHHCIHQHKVCDGVKDCENGTDESSCGTGISSIKDLDLSRKNAVSWLKRQRLPSFGWSKNTHRALIVLYLLGGASFQGKNKEEKLMAKQLELETAGALLRNSSIPLSVDDLSLFINALSVTCHNPYKFHGYNLVQILVERVTTVKPPNPFDYLTLCNANIQFEESDVRNFLGALNQLSEYQFNSDMQAMTIMTINCIKKKAGASYSKMDPMDISKKILTKLLKSQQPDGSFGNIYTTSLVTQALLSSGEENNSTWNVTNAVEYLMLKLKSPPRDFLSSSLTLPIFNVKSLVDMGTVKCSKQRS